jgi:hypothetical protein
MEINKEIPIADGVPVYCAYREIVEIEKVVEHPRNPNKHPDRQIALLSKIISKQGWRNPITVSTLSGYIIRGHARLLAAKVLGVTKVPIDFQHYGSEAEEFADMVADNRIQELSDLALPETKSLIEELERAGMDMDLTGYDKESLQTLKQAFIPSESMTPTGLPDPDVTGFDPSQGRFILIYTNEEEKAFWMKKLGMDGRKIIWTVSEIGPAENEPTIQN